ncbi:SRPBCC family protein [Amycolatopsis taiwanensis]|uniref:SRPBCC family protein n=1 Tax=Amycolatopsis taiwanensis TaxID=342230 RepID=UPI0004889706|nr:SRPBCC domain-containing protein [Amycolatopsis taiwanensis]
MVREFELRKEVVLESSLEQVWHAIATAEGNSVWLFPTGDLHPDDPSVTTWDPPRRLAVRLPAADDGSTQSFEYLIEARDGGTTALRFVHSGILGDDWHDEYADMTSIGWDMYLHTLSEYFRHFPGRAATFVAAEGPAVSAAEEAWPKMLLALGLPGTPEIDEVVRLTPDGLAPIEGVVDYTGPSFLGLRTADAMYRFHGRAQLDMPIAVGHHLYGPDVDPDKACAGWQDWLSRVFA